MEPCKQECWDMWRFDGFHPLSLMLVLHIQRSRWERGIALWACTGYTLAQFPVQMADRVKDGWYLSKTLKVILKEKSSGNGKTCQLNARSLTCAINMNHQLEHVKPLVVIHNMYVYIFIHGSKQKKTCPPSVFIWRVSPPCCIGHKEP